MSRDQVKISLALLVILAAGVTLGMTLVSRPPRVPREPHTELGRVMAEQALQLLVAGGRISLIARDTSAYPNPAADLQLRSFLATLAKAKVKLASTNLVRLDPIRVVRVPPGDFFMLLRKQTETDVVVSFLGPALLTPQQVKQLGKHRPKLVALCAGNLPRELDLRDLFTRDLLHVSVIDRTPEPARAAGPGARHSFAELYEIVSPTNLEPLPEFRAPAGTL